jgi:hypothetical protein
MHRRFSLAAVSWLLFLGLSSIVPAALAQAGPDIFVTPVPHAPFRGVIKVERSLVQPDGSILKLKTIREIARDSQGRIHNESRSMVPVSSNQTPQIVRIHLFDPETRTSVMLDPAERTFWSMTVNHPPATVPPRLLYASPTGTALPPNEFTKEEDLGMREMEGGPVHGVREIQAIPAEGNGKEIVVTDEYWYSDDLRINMVIAHNDPRTGSVTMTVTQLTRSEPDAALFEIPDGYRRPKAGQVR